MKHLKKYNFLDFIKRFNLNYKESASQENNLNTEERKQLKFCQALLRDLHILVPEYKWDEIQPNIPTREIKEEYLKTPHICDGGTCGHGICPNIGKLTKCDTGCTYSG